MPALESNHVSSCLPRYHPKFISHLPQNVTLFGQVFTEAGQSRWGYLDGLSSDWHLYQKGKQCSETWEVQDGGEGLEKDGWPPVWEETLQESVPQLTEGNQPAYTLLGSQLWFQRSEAEL